MIKIGVVGINGKMGKAVLEAALHEGMQDKFSIAALAKTHSETLNNKIFFYKSLEELLIEVDVVIDFTSPNYSLELAEIVALNKKAMVCGTTGFDQFQFSKLNSLALNTPIFWASNMSINVHLYKQLVSQAAKVLEEDFDVEILEMHHRNKVDAPSGTALMLGNTIAEVWGKQLSQIQVLDRTNHSEKRKPGSIGFATLRGGGIIGEHNVIFTSDVEKIELKHTSFSRAIYANSALIIAQWLINKAAIGLYDMQSFLNERFF